MVTLDAKFFKTLGQLADAIEPYLKDVIFIGGVANALYEFHPKGKASGSPVLMTNDLDLATARNFAPLKPTEPLAALLDRAGFKVNPEILTSLNLTKFQLMDDQGKVDGSYEVEFLCPLTKHRPEPDHIEVQPGISSTPLQYIELLLFEPWELELRLLPGLADCRRVIRVPNPGVYVVQKFITMFRRQKLASKRKDAFYIYELCLKFRDSLELVSECVDRLQAHSHYRKVKTFKADFSGYFENEGTDGIAAIMKELDTLPFDEKALKPDAATVTAIIRRLVDAWEAPAAT